jgi:heme A synthase
LIATFEIAPQASKTAAWREMFERKVATAVVLVAVLLAGFIVGRASEPEETAITVQVTSADHEVAEGYFSLGGSATLIAKPGTDFHRFLANRRGHQIRVTLTEAARAEPSRISR